jgi:hypothetical protein
MYSRLTIQRGLDTTVRGPRSSSFLLHWIGKPSPAIQCWLRVERLVRCGSDSSASACCTAGPSSNLGSAPLEEALYRADAMRTTIVELHE